MPDRFPPACGWLLALGTVTLLATGCGQRESPAAAGLRSGTLLLGNGAEPADLDPAVVTAYTEHNILMALFEGLTALDETTSRPVPAAAERWNVSSDRLTWTFHLRPGQHWSNGDPLTAGDFVTAWRRLLTPAFGAENASYLFPILNAGPYNRGDIADPVALGISAPDDHTLIVRLKRPTPYFAMVTAQPSTFPVNPRVLARHDALAHRGTSWTRPGNLVGNGPFVLRAWVANARIVVGRNPRYRAAESVRLNEIVFLPTESPEADERNFRAGQVHATFTLPVTKVTAWQENDPGRLRLDPFLQTIFLRFNTTRPPFDDVRMRRALALAIDREAISRHVLQGSRAAAFALTPPGTGGYTARARVGMDFAAARSLLAKAGHAQGAGLPVMEILCRNDAVQPRVAEVLQAAWQRELGIRVSLMPAEQKTWLQGQQNLDYTISFSSWIGDFPDPANFLGLFAGDGSYNWTGWRDDNFDVRLTSADLASSPEQRHELLQQAEEILLDAAPIAPLFHGAQTYLLHEAVRGWPASLLGTRRYVDVHFER